MAKEITLDPEVIKSFNYGLRELRRAKDELTLAKISFENCRDDSSEKVVNSIFDQVAKDISYSLTTVVFTIENFEKVKSGL